MAVFLRRVREQGHGGIDVRRAVVLQSVAIPVDAGNRAAQVLVLVVVSQGAGRDVRELPAAQVLEVSWPHPIRQAPVAEIIDVTAGDHQIEVAIQFAVQKLRPPTQHLMRGPFQTRVALGLDKGVVRLLRKQVDGLPIEIGNQNIQLAILVGVGHGDSHAGRVRPMES